MKTFLGIFIFCTIAFLSYAIYNYISTWGALEGDIVFEITADTPEISTEGMYVFLISPQIEDSLDILDNDYNRTWASLEDTIVYLRQRVKEYTRQAQEEEVLFNVTYGDIVKRTKLYQESKNYLDKVKADRDSVDALFAEKRDRLIKKQSDYNSVIASLIENKVIFKAEVDSTGHFPFPKIPNGDYFIYALRIFSGNIDITNIPADMYYFYALSGETMRKYSWMFKITINEDTYVKLDKSNMSQIFK